MCRYLEPAVSIALRAEQALIGLTEHVELRVTEATVWTVCGLSGNMEDGGAHGHGRGGRVLQRRHCCVCLSHERVKRGAVGAFRKARLLPRLQNNVKVEQTARDGVLSWV